MNYISNKLNIDIYKAFEKHRIDGDKTIVVMWKNGQLNTAMRSSARKHELIDRLKEWLES
jgi:hypothetical protein